MLTFIHRCHRSVNYDGYEMRQPESSDGATDPAYKQPVFPVVENDRRAFHRVPGGPLSVIEVAVPLVDSPIGEGAHHRFLLPHRRGSCRRPVGPRRARCRAAGRRSLGEKQIPVPAGGVLERVAVDGEFQVREHPFPRVLERSGRLVGYRDAHFAVSRVVEEEFPVPPGDLRSPIFLDGFDGIHRPADHLPVGEIPRAQDGELFPVRCLAGADGIEGVTQLECVGVGEGTVPEWVGVGDFPGAAGEGENQGGGGGNGFEHHAGWIIRKMPREIEGIPGLRETIPFESKRRVSVPMLVSRDPAALTDPVHFAPFDSRWSRSSHK